MNWQRGAGLCWLHHLLMLCKLGLCIVNVRWIFKYIHVRDLSCMAFKRASWTHTAYLTCEVSFQMILKRTMRNIYDPLKQNVSGTCRLNLSASNNPLFLSNLRFRKVYIISIDFMRTVTRSAFSTALAGLCNFTGIHLYFFHYLLDLLN